VAEPLQHPLQTLEVPRARRDERGAGARALRSHAAGRSIGCTHRRWLARCVRWIETTTQEAAVFTHLGPEPLQGLLSRKDVRENRYLFCSEYERCLDAALKNAWVSWTCGRCVRFMALRQHEAAAKRRTLPSIRTTH
jgi:hypothetical protein